MSKLNHNHNHDTEIMQTSVSTHLPKLLLTAGSKQVLLYSRYSICMQANVNSNVQVRSLWWEQTNVGSSLWVKLTLASLSVDQPNISSCSQLRVYKALLIWRLAALYLKNKNQSGRLNKRLNDLLRWIYFCSAPKSLFPGETMMRHTSKRGSSCCLLYPRAKTEHLKYL